MSPLLKFVTPLLAIIIAAWFDIVRDSPIPAGIMAAMAILALVVRDAVEHIVLTYALTHQPKPVATPAKTDEYTTYCDTLCLEDFEAALTDALMDEYDEMPDCAVVGCKYKAPRCLTHRYTNTTQRDPFDQIQGKTLEA